MLTAFFIIACITLALAALVAAWPILLTRVLRPAVLASAGILCLVSGVLCSLLATSLVAQEIAQQPGFLETTTAPPEPSSAPGSGADANSVPTVSAADSPSADSPATDSFDDHPGDGPALAPEPVEPSVVIPPGRPAWVETQPSLAGEVQTVPVSSGPYKTHALCMRELDNALVQATNDYIVDYLGSDLALLSIRYDARTIRQRFVKPQNLYEEQLVIRDPVGTVRQVHALVEFDPTFRSELDAKWAKFQATSRLWQGGLFAGAALFLLGTVYSYFRLDNATRGYYTGRLQFLSAAAILTLIGAGVMLARWITWL